MIDPPSVTDDQGMVRALRSLIADERRARRELAERIPLYQDRVSFFRQALRALQSPMKYG